MAVTVLETAVEMKMDFLSIIKDLEEAIEALKRRRKRKPPRNPFTSGKPLLPPFRDTVFIPGFGTWGTAGLTDPSESYGPGTTPTGHG